MDEIINLLAMEIRLTKPDMRPDGYWFETADIDVKQVAEIMSKNKFRLSTMTALERKDGETDIIYHFASLAIAVNIRTTTVKQHISSMATYLPAANWIEREIHDLYAVEFDNHPDMRPLVRPPEMPVGFFRKSVATTLKNGSEVK